jgi:predicted RNase H-like HicB family nuclease
MQQETILDAYTHEAMKRAEYKHLRDGSWSGRVPGLKGVIAFAETRTDCERELESVIEDWARVLLEHDRTPPTLGGIDFSDPDRRRVALGYN